MLNINNNKLEQMLNVEGEWLLEKLVEEFKNENSRNYYQGRVDQLAQVRRILGHAQLMVESEKASK
jgi:hypothetical protein